MSELPPQINKEIETLTVSVEKINSDNDIDQFVNQNKTHQEIPEPFEYEPYQQGNQAPRTKPKDKLKKFIRKAASSPTQRLPDQVFLFLFSFYYFFFIY